MKFFDFSNKKTKAVAITLSACLVCGTVGGVAYSANKTDSTSLLMRIDLCLMKFRIWTAKWR